MVVQISGSGHQSHSRRPKRSPSTKTGTCEVALILELRSQRNLGARRIQSELKRLHSISLAMATIHKVLCQHQVKPVVKFRRKADFIRYERPVPGDRGQMDTCKIGPGLYQYHQCEARRLQRTFPACRSTVTGPVMGLVWAVTLAAARS